MREMEVLAKTQEEAIEKASKAAETKSEYLEVIEEYEPDEIDLKQHAEEEGLSDPLNKDEITLYIVRFGYSYYTEKAEEWTQGMIERFAPESTATAVRFRDLIIVRLEVPETSILIGKKGATLDALQHVVVRALLTEDEKFPDVMLDVEGYRENKLVRLEKEARQAANRALRTGRPVPLTPMSPAERKFIHNMLKDLKDIRTESRGQDRGRHIVVEPTGSAAQGRRGHGKPGGNKSTGGGTKRRSGGGGSRPQGTPGVLSKDSRPDEITEEQRQLLYGRMAAQREKEEEEAREQLLEEKRSLLPEYVPEDSDEADGDDSSLVDELE